MQMIQNFSVMENLELTEEEKAYNRAAGQENERIARWRVSDDASEVKQKKAKK